MPSQRVHDASCLAAAGIIASVGLVLWKMPLFAVSAGTAMGTLIHPDWDYAEARGVVAELGPLKYLIKPYGLLVPHRHWISHLPVVGTIGRLLYIMLPLFIVGFSFSSGNPVVKILRNHYFWYGFLGLALADTIHFALDMAQTGVKRFLRQLVRGVREKI